ncbi:MAG: hypothetical protein Q8N99_00455 [Nanoarchaeota archaeon]|nr:hypothetical protein [Nanoarchaeota archaeon]
MKWKKELILSLGILIFINLISLVLAQCLGGFFYEGRCYRIGNEIKINNTYYYVDLDGKIKLQKQDNHKCMNDFECLNNLCSDGVCVNLNKELKDNTQIIKNISKQNITTCGNKICDRTIGENETNCPQDCYTGPDFYISLATLKDSYSINEKIELTDPPEEENLFQIIKNIFKWIF